MTILTFTINARRWRGACDFDLAEPVSVPERDEAYMRVDNSRGITIAKDYRREEASRQGKTPSTGTSLVPVENTAPVESREPRAPRALATFVTQLIAKEQNAPHTRVRCRAEPSEVAQSYRKMLSINGVPNRYTKQDLARPF